MTPDAADRDPSPASPGPTPDRASPGGDPDVTFIIPCFNHGDFVGESVRSCLAQRGANVHVIVVDDGSTDGTTPKRCDDAARDDPRVHVVHQPNRGLSGARNAGLRARRDLRLDTEYVAFLDADDWVEPTFARTLHDAIGADGADDVSHAYCQERLTGLANMVWEVPEWDPLLEMITNLHPVTALIRADRLADAPFDESMREGYEDWDLWLGFVARGWRGVRVREPLFVWRRHSETTMIVEAATRHQRLFRRLVENHRALYARHAEDLIVLSNELLRRADASWLDEQGRAIPLRDMRAHVEHLLEHVKAQHAEHERLGHELGEARVALGAARTRAEIAEQRAGASEHRAARAEWERDDLASLAVVRVWKRWRSLTDNARGPVGWVLRGVHRLTRRLVGRRGPVDHTGARRD